MKVVHIQRCPTRWATSEKKWKKDRSREEKKQKRLQKKFGNSFYTSEQWLRLRYIVLKEAEGRCMACGSRNRLHVDHIRPRSRYPELSLEKSNLQVLCHDCNMGKGAWDETNWRDMDDEYKTALELDE